jgi:hypothetical protein
MRTRRTLLILALGMVVAIAVPLVVLAGGGSGPLNRHEQGTPTLPAQKSTKTWTNIPGWGNRPVCTDTGLLTTNVNLTASGGAFRVRVVLDGNTGGAAQFDPTRGNRSFSYTFGGGVSDANHDVDIQWRSVTGDTVTLNHGLYVFFFQACV